MSPTLPFSSASASLAVWQLSRPTRRRRGEEKEWERPSDARKSREGRRKRTIRLVTGRHADAKNHTDSRYKREKEPVLPAHLSERLSSSVGPSNKTMNMRECDLRQQDVPATAAALRSPPLASALSLCLACLVCAYVSAFRPDSRPPLIIHADARRELPHKRRASERVSAGSASRADRERKGKVSRRDQQICSQPERCAASS